MIEQQLILLGLLKESPKHGYEIKKRIEEIPALFAGIDLKSIYYPLQGLEKKGLVIKQTTKGGRRPERFVYALTPRGEERFKQLLAQSFLNFKRPQFSLDLSLYFLRYIKPEIARRRLQARMQILKSLFRDLRQVIDSLKKKKASSLVYISEHNLRMIEAERKFLAKFIKIL
ncbi:MAG: PadR family transcriptional regulator [Candidatus Omnitrophota bacterium]|jgi:DNA-binding PadR family transcriptional regulator